MPSHGAVVETVRRRIAWAWIGWLQDAHQTPLNQVLVRIGVYALFEDHRYQRALNQMIVTYFMVGRMTDGDYKLPVIVR